MIKIISTIIITTTIFFSSSSCKSYDVICICGFLGDFRLYYLFYNYICFISHTHRHEHTSVHTQKNFDNHTHIHTNISHTNSYSQKNFHTHYTPAHNSQMKQTTHVHPFTHKRTYIHINSKNRPHTFPYMHTHASTQIRC